MTTLPSEPAAQPASTAVAPPATGLDCQQARDEEPVLVLDDRLVEDVSIDGMCGVY